MFSGLSNSVASIIVGGLIGIIGRIPVFTAGFLIQLTLILCLLLELVYPHPNHIEWLFFFACAWGACDGVWQPAINGKLIHVYVLLFVYVYA